MRSALSFSLVLLLIADERVSGGGQLEDDFLETVGEKVMEDNVKDGKQAEKNREYSRGSLVTY